MAMLVLPDVFERTWGRRAPLFWPDAIRRVRESVPGFCFMAEVYWDLEWTMQQQGFDYAYDKRLYDRLRDGHARPVRQHLHAGLDYQGKLARFMENHDEPRAAATFAPGMHEAAAVITYLSPGLRFFHQGQFEGRRKRISPHLVRAPLEATDGALQQFYDRLLAVLHHPTVRDGDWRLLECTPAWEGNWTSDCFVAWLWTSTAGDRRLVAVNYAANQSQCYVRLPQQDHGHRPVRFEDQMGPACFDRDRHDLDARGLYLDMPAWGYHVFDVTAGDYRSTCAISFAAVARAGDLFGRERRVELGHLRGAERHVRARDVLLEIRAPLGAGDRHDVRPLVQQPGERDLPGRQPPCARPARAPPPRPACWRRSSRPDSAGRCDG